MSQELAARHAGCRAFSNTRHPGFADCAPSGRVRLDAIARWLQDVAYEDVEDAGLQHASVWVVRRTRLLVHEFPRFGQRFEVTTFCSGLGRMWAERRTDLVAMGGERPIVEAVSVWVHLDPRLLRPAVLTEAEITTYGGAAPERRISARLRHPIAPKTVAGDGAPVQSPWIFRLTECDIADHVNNAAYWGPLEEELLAGPEPDSIDVEIEYRAPAQAGPMRVLRDRGQRWLVGEDGELHASILVLDLVPG
jgi:acyl-ACP thioesterase